MDSMTNEMFLMSVAIELKKISPNTTMVDCVKEAKNAMEEAYKK